MSQPCPFCHSEQTHFEWDTIDLQGNKWNLYKCNSCNFYFLNPFPTDSQLNEAYDISYYGEGDKKFSFPLVEKVLDHFRSGRARSIKKLLNENIHASVLDIGCGNGRFLNYLHNLRFTNLFGIELPGNSANRAASYKYLKIFIGEIDHANFERESMNAITMFHVLEHMKNPLEIIPKVHSWLKLQGIFMVSFPNIASRQAQKFKGNWLHLDPPRHLNFIAPKDFILHMQQTGFELISEHYFSAEQNPFGYVQSDLNRHAPKREILFESLKGNKKYLQDVSKRTLWLHRLYFALTMPYYFCLDVVESWQKKSGTVTFVFKKK